METKPYVYIYGTGWGSTVAQLLKEQGYEIIGMWSYDQEELKSICDKLNIPFSTNDKDELLQHQVQRHKSKDPDAIDAIVWVATPPHHLAFVSRQILEYGNNIVVEAPGVTNVEEGERLLESASKYATWLCACTYQLRNLPAVRELRNYITSRKYGAVKSIEVRVQCNQTTMCSKKYNWKYDKNRGGGALNMFGCHIIDLLTFLLNETKVEAVQGTLQTFVKQNQHINGIRLITADDVCNFSLLFKALKNNLYFADESIVAWVHISMLYPNTVFKQEVTVLTEQACLILDNCDLKIIPFRNENDNTEVKTEYFKEEDPKFNCSDLEAGLPLPYILGMKYFIDSINIQKLQTPYDDSQPKTRLKALQHIVKVLEKVRESSEQRNRRWLSVEPKDTKVTLDPKSKTSVRGTSLHSKTMSVSP